jgi:hypothetical protein
MNSTLTWWSTRLIGDRNAKRRHPSGARATRFVRPEIGDFALAPPAAPRRSECGDRRIALRSARVRKETKPNCQSGDHACHLVHWSSCCAAVLNRYMVDARCRGHYRRVRASASPERAMLGMGLLGNCLLFGPLFGPGPLLADLLLSAARAVDIAGNGAGSLASTPERMDALLTRY